MTATTKRSLPDAEATFSTPPKSSKKTKKTKDLKSDEQHSPVVNHLETSDSSETVSIPYRKLFFPTNLF